MVTLPEVCCQGAFASLHAQKGLTGPISLACTIIQPHETHEASLLENTGEFIVPQSQVDSHAMQDSRLNYIEQHAERIGLDSDKLENLRVSASKASPMGDTLDMCARYADGKTLDEMVGRPCMPCLVLMCPAGCCDKDIICPVLPATPMQCYCLALDFALPVLLRLDNLFVKT